MKICNNCQAAHNTHFKCCELCRQQWREEKPSKKSFNKKLLNEAITELAALPNLGKIVTKLTIVRDLL